MKSKGTRISLYILVVLKLFTYLVYQCRLSDSCYCHLARSWLGPHGVAEIQFNSVKMNRNLILLSRCVFCNRRYSTLYRPLLVPWPSVQRTFSKGSSFTFWASILSISSSSVCIVFGLVHYGANWIKFPLFWKFYVVSSNIITADMFISNWLTFYKRINGVFCVSGEVFKYLYSGLLIMQFIVILFLLDGHVTRYFCFSTFERLVVTY